MDEFSTTIKGGDTLRIKTAGKYCERDILVYAESNVVKEAALKDVNFYDYDGTRLYSYTVAEAQALTALPPLPSREGLICQGWNYDLETIKSYNRMVDVGAMYITDDGKTRLYIRLDGRLHVPLYFSQNVVHGVTIDWGDGTATETLMGTGDKNTTHTYAESGDYVISLEVAEGCTLGLGKKQGGHNLFGDYVSSGTDYLYGNVLRKVEIGSGVLSLTEGAFDSCYALADVVIPYGVTYVTSRTGTVFYNCYSLRFAVFPSSVTDMGTSSTILYNCYSVRGVVLPGSVKGEIGRLATTCYGISRLVLPEGVITFNGVSHSYNISRVVLPGTLTSIGYNAFYQCRGLSILDCTACKQVPILEQSYMFEYAPSDFKILVPSSLYYEWIGSTGWAYYASNTVAV